MREQQQSKTFRKGEPKSHIDAVNYVCDFIGTYWDYIFDSLPQVHAPLRFWLPQEFINKHKLKYNKHAFDIGCTLYRDPVLIMEIGGIGDDTRHSKKSQRINDGVAQSFIEEYYPKCRFFRFNKDDAMYRSFLTKNLFKGWINK